MILFKTLSFFWFFVTTLSGPVQRNRVDDKHLQIPQITLDARNNCGVEGFLADQGTPSCNVVLPLADSNYFKVSQAILCFGAYDTLYELCKYQNLTSLEVPRYLPINKFCDRLGRSLDNYNFSHKSEVFFEWTPLVRSGLSGAVNCTDVCIHGEDVNPFCGVIVAALERYPAAVAAASQSIPNSLAQPRGGLLPIGKGSTPSAVQQLLPSPTKEAAPAPAKEKTPAPADPVAPEPNVKPEEKVEKSPLVVKSPLSPEPEKPEMEKPNMDDPNQGNPDLEADVGDDTDGEEGIPPQERQPGETSVVQQHDPIGAKDEPKFIEEEIKGKPEIPMVGPVDGDGSSYLTVPKDDSEETNMVTYFVLMTGGALLFYVAFHNKNKLLALALEGRRTGRRGGRHSSASYSKLHSNLEETISAGPTSPSATHVLY